MGSEMCIRDSTKMDKQVGEKTVSGWLTWIGQMLDDYDPDNFTVEEIIREITK